MKIIIAYGLTDTFTANDGIDQGELRWPDDTFCNDKQIILIRTAASAFADDTQWIAKSKDEAKKITLIANKFFDINDIKINGEKSEIIVVNLEDNNESERFIEIEESKDKVTANKGSVPIRILGVWFKANKDDKHIEVIIKKEISTVLGAIRRKHIIHAQAIYIINIVLLPRLEYRLKTTIWKDRKYEEIFKPVMKVVKYKVRLPANCHDNILLHSAQRKLKNLWRNQIATQVTEFLVVLNSQSKQADILKIRLKKVQLALNIALCIPTMDPDVTVFNKLPNNHAYNVKDKEIIIRKAAALLIYGALQLLNYDASNTITWQQICDINKSPAKRRTPKWFITLSRFIQYSFQLKDLCKVDAELLTLESMPETERKTFANMQALKMSKKILSTNNRKREFVWTHQDHNLILGQINKKHTTRKYTIKYYVIINNTQKDNNEIMYKTIQCCNGCLLNDKRINKGNHNYYFNKYRLDLNCINRISSCKNTPDTKIIKDILEIRHYPKSQHSSKHTPNLIQIYDYNTAFIQNTLSDKESTTQHIALLHYLRSIFNTSDIINIYTDGSLTSRFNIELNTLTKHMGTGWVILNNKDEVIVECSSSIKDWPSSTRAELEAILSIMLVLQTG
ncbi:hypothetical protein GLOIN_2v1765740 [Rhizophagus clarus]|uniref:RNase H type-1 domain-containing protein n=1 Tax=Rhizophagus clarus TaxID=94130 RepID=A0A8H3QC99_9GLOM|nr:hypothetical protein GLOIN_2v1765740 [Rhizophagus clarus]